MAQIGSSWVSTSWTVPAWEEGSWSGGVPVVTVDAPPSPTVLVVLTGNTDMMYLSDRGATMPSPTSFTAGTTGAYDMALIGSDGSRENLTGATATLVVQSVSGGTPIVNGVVLTVLDTLMGTVRWTRTALQTATPGDYLMQVSVVRSDDTEGAYPDSSEGDLLTIRSRLGS